ncbi:LPXTG cell wall anchor domain-containing protein [Modestobacter sp. URMC 112]
MTRLFRSRVAVATGLTVGTAAAGLAFATVASAAELTAPVAPATIAAGAEFTVTGTGCMTVEEDYPAYAVVLTDAANDTDEIAVGEADAEGNWSVTLSFPADVELGAHELGALCDNTYAGEPLEYPIVGITVTAAGTNPAPAPAPDQKQTVDTPAPASTPVPAAIRGASANTPGIVAKTSSASASELAPGKQVTRVLTGFKPNEQVTLTMHSTPVVLGTFTADANGVVTATFTIPAGTALSDHTFVYVGADGSYFQETLRVGSGAAVATAGSGLAYTGADVAVPLALGGALVLAGGGALLVARRRNTGATQA